MAAIAEAITEAVGETRSVEGVVERVHGRNVLLKSVREAGNVGEHRRRTSAAIAKRARSTADVMQLREGEAGESVGVWRHSGAGKWAFRRRRNRLVVHALHKKGLVVLSGLKQLGSSNVLLFRATFKSVDAAAILLLNINTLLSQSMALLLPPLLGRESFLVGGD
jgi:sarcosine oxidase delta subunit